MNKPTCAYPDCERGAASRGKRGENSEVAPNGKKYFKWCLQHRKGKLKAERIQFNTTTNTGAEEMK